MGNVYTTNIFSATLVSGGLFVFDTPDGFMTVIRDVSVMMTAPEAFACFFKLNLNGGTFWEVGCPPAGQRFEQYEGRIAVPGGNEIQFLCEGGSLLNTATVNCTVYELTLP